VDVDALDTPCPEMCRDQNVNFHLEQDMSETEMWALAQKKCEYKMCKVCQGGALGVPCCTDGPECSVPVRKEEEERTPVIEEMIVPEHVAPLGEDEDTKPPVVEALIKPSHVSPLGEDEETKPPVVEEIIQPEHVSPLGEDEDTLPPVEEELIVPVHVAPLGREQNPNCPDVCKNLNLHFMTEQDISDAEIRDYVQKKCAFSMCAKCQGSPEELGTPCCIVGEVCEVAEDGEDEELGKDVMMPTRPFRMGPRGARGARKPIRRAPEARQVEEEKTGMNAEADQPDDADEEESVEDEEEVSIITTSKGEVCNYLDTPWCPPGTKNLGPKHRKEGKPLCCKSAAGSEASESEAEASTTTNKPVVTEDEVVDLDGMPDCVEGGVFKYKMIKKKGVDKTLMCLNMKLGLPVNRACCDIVNSGNSFTHKTSKGLKATQACEAVSHRVCRKDPSIFEKYRRRYPDVPQGFSCVRKYYCVDGKELVRFGPVDSKEMCEKGKNNRIKRTYAPREYCVAESVK